MISEVMARLSAFTKAQLAITGLFLLLTGWSTGVWAQFPVAGFSSNITTGCAPLTVNFTNQSTQADIWFWDFGNGNTSTLQDPVSVYTAPGSYTVSLVAINSLTGFRDTLILVGYITVPDDAAADFSAPVLNGCAGYNNISFNNLSSNAVSYIWDFGDGTFSNAVNPVHNYLTPGTYTVKLIAANSYGCTKVKTRTAYINIYPVPVASFTVDQQSTCTQSQIFNFTSTSTGAGTWQWDFGDGTGSSLENPVHTYSTPGSYTVSLVVSNSYGCSDTVIQQAFINIGPTLVPTYTASTQAGCVPLATNFNCTVSNATSWLWDFGDGTTSTLENPSHLYTTPGTYDITLTVTTVTGCNGTVTNIGFITVDPLPVAQFTVSNGTGCKPVVANFTSTSTGASSWLWDFGNGITLTDENPTYIFNNVGSHGVTLTVYTNNGCSSTVTMDSIITVNDITATFAATPKIGCAPLPVDFTASSTPPAVSWQWDLGDGTTAITQNVNHTYTAIGNYNVSLIVTSAEGCRDTVYKSAYIKVVTDTTPYTVPDTIIVCTPPGTVSFTDPTTGSNSWLWDFGDGTTSSVKNPTHTYTTPGVYVVTLNTGMAGGCTQVFNPYAIINVIPFVISPITAVIVSPCGPYTVHFENGTLDVVSYLWDFGDGTMSTDQNPVHTYAQPGHYHITLLLTAVSGCQTSLSADVSFGHDNPITISNPDVCLGELISFGLSPVADFIQATWDFGDGTTSNQLQPDHMYAAEGTYHVTVTIQDTDGCVYTYDSPVDVIISNPVPSFMVNQPTTGCINFNVQFTNMSTGASSFLWDFGDGSTSTLLNPGHTYSVAGVYSVTLTATSNGCTRSFTIPNLITANQAVADFSFTPTTGCLPITVTYTDLSVNPVSWVWDFGDGSSSTVQNPVHVFSVDPPGNVKLTIVDVNGCTRTKTRSNIHPVIPIIQVSDSSGCRPLLVNFSTPTSAVTYFWDFGDGITSTLRNPVHLYTVAGTYTVTLTCTLSSGCTTSTVKQDFIRVNAPVADFMSPTVSVCAPSLVNFVNLSSGATSWLWNFGDGTTSTNENPAHIYNIPGTYTVSLIAWSAEGCVDTLVKVDYIVVPGTYTYFTLASGINCLNTVVQFVDSSVSASSWFWNFGDGFTSTLQNPSHLYADSGSYIVTLITSDGTGCSSFYSSPNPIVVTPIPEAIANLSVHSGCQPLEVEFSNQSTGGVSWLWNFGNGDTSSSNSPAYTYTNPGVYSPSLVVYSSAGCSDTISFPDGVTVYEVPDAAISTSVTSGCAPLGVTFTDNSTHLSGPAYHWDFGNGVVGTSLNHTIIYDTAGIYNISLVVTNAGGCTDSNDVTITVFQPPVAKGVLSVTSGCAPLEIGFSDSSLYHASLLWDFGDGSTSTAAAGNHTYSTEGTYYPVLIAYSAEGCTDTLHFSEPVQVYPVPRAAFTVNHNAACPGSGFQFTNQSTPASGLTWMWNIGGAASSVQNPTISLSSPGFYDVSLYVTNQYGCSDSLVEPAFIQVFDTIPPPVSPILSVSVLDNTQVEITWQNNPALDLGAYILYRKDASSGIFNEIYRDSNPANASLNLTSVYTDAGLNTLQNVYTYKLQTTDVCAYTLPLSALTAHTTINITAVPVNNDINVSWTPYRGCNVATYELNRVNLVTGASTHIATLPSNTLSYVDRGFYCPHDYSYRVTATDLCGNPYISNSDTSVATPANLLASQKVEVVRSTVISDRDVLTEWKAPQLAPERVKQYRISRSVDYINFTEVALVPAGIFSYVDDRTDVHGQEYYYKVEVVNDCDMLGAPSNKSSSILLKSHHADDKTRLWWTPYRDWDTGVDYYIIEKQNWSGQWEQIRRVGGSELETTLDE